MTECRQNIRQVNAHSQLVVSYELWDVDKLLLDHVKIILVVIFAVHLIINAGWLEKITLLLG